MEPLISDSEMSALRLLPLSGMQTPCSIIRHTTIEVDGADDQQVWAEIESTVCWIWEPPDYPRGDTVVGGQLGGAHEFRAYLPVGTDVREGDKLGVNGDLFNVLNTNAHNTYMPMLRAAVRRQE